MFRNDVSYLYSDEYFLSSFTTDKELSPKVSNPASVHRKTTPLLPTSRRSKHIILFTDDVLKRDKRQDKNRTSPRYVKEKRQYLEENLCQKLKVLENEKTHLQTHVIQLQSHKQDLQNELNNHNFSMDSINQLFSTEPNPTPSYFNQYSNDSHLFDMSITDVFKLNSDYDVNLDD